LEGSFQVWWPWASEWLCGSNMIIPPIGVRASIIAQE